MRGRSSMSTRTIATSASVSTPLIARPNGLPVQNIRWITGSISGRSVRMSRAVTRWIVARINDARTAFRLVSRSASSTGSKPSRRVQRPMYGSIGTCACIPTQPFDRVGRGERRPFEQQLPRERGAVELPDREHVW